MPETKTCIIGCGAIMPVHADALSQLPGVRLAAVADIVEARAAAAGGKYHCRAYTDWQEMLLSEKPDAVHICTPHYLHAPMAIFALEHGIHILTEKPPGITVEDAEKIIGARDAYHKTAAVVFQNRLNGATIAVKKIIDSNEHGRILGMKALVTWHRTEEYYTESGWRGKYATEGGGVLINQSIHTLDLMRYLAGKVSRVRAHIDTFVLSDVIEVEDTASAVLFFENGSRGVFYATTGYLADSPVEIEIVLERATLLMRGEEVFLTENGETKALALHPDGDTVYKAYWGMSHKKLIERFYGDLNNERPFVSIDEGIETLKIIDAIRRASFTGKSAEII